MEHFLKFLIVGSLGFVINTTVLLLGVKRIGLKPSIAGPLGAELAILSNFTLNNIWTFSDRTITSWETLPLKFLQFNILSFGSVAIQFIFLKTGEMIFGLPEFKKPFIDRPAFRSLFLVKDTIALVESIKLLNRLARKFSIYFIFYMAGVGVGLVVNFTIYSQIIWRSIN